MGNRIRAFFYGRNGFDTIAKTVFITSLIVMLGSNFIGIGWLRYTLYSASIFGCVYAYFRIFSRNLDKRRRENAVFCECFHIAKLRWKERKTHRYFRCPQCKTWLRVPKGRGEITVTCRSCSKRFDQKT